MGLNYASDLAPRRKRIAIFFRMTIAILLLLVVISVGLGTYVFRLESETQTVTFTPIKSPLNNPLMGLAPWATAKESLQPHTLVYADLSWREFEAQKGVYNFDDFEKSNQFERWRSEGKRVVFRFVCDFPKKSEHIDIPDWLYEEIKGDGDRYSSSHGFGFSPNYENPTFIAYHKKAIQALGERYSKDDFIAYIELGSLGHWGEWHTDETAGVRQLPKSDIRDQYVMHYRDAFPNTHLLLRRPFAIAQKLDLGVYNDMAGDPKSTEKWLEWIRQGGEYNETNEPDALRPMAEGWKRAPIGGEQTSSIKDEEMYGPLIDQTLRLFQDSHASFIGPGGPYDVKAGGPLQPGIDRVLAGIGYRLYVQQIQLPRTLVVTKSLEITVTFANDGIAPIYYGWPAEFYVFDQSNNLRVTQTANIDIRNILPGDTNTYKVIIPAETLENGKYTICFAILDPLTSLPAIQLAMENPRQDLIQELGKFEVKYAVH